MAFIDLAEEKRNAIYFEGFIENCYMDTAFIDDPLNIL
jgi:hypothetical protein